MSRSVGFDIPTSVLDNLVMNKRYGQFKGPRLEFDPPSQQDNETAPIDKDPFEGIDHEPEQKASDEEREKRRKKIAQERLDEECRQCGVPIRNGTCSSCIALRRKSGEDYPPLRPRVEQKKVIKGKFDVKTGKGTPQFEEMRQQTKQAVQRFKEREKEETIPFTQRDEIKALRKKLEEQNYQDKNDKK